MLDTEEMLFDEYKRVDNICRDMYLCQSGISQYIMEMEQNSFHGSSIVPLWDRDYRKLKRARWLRNQIAHTSYSTDCCEEDVVWLEEFHSRLLKREDPLALLAEARRKRESSTPQVESRPIAVFEQRTGRNDHLELGSQLWKQQDLFVLPEKTKCEGVGSPPRCEGKPTVGHKRNADKHTGLPGKETSSKRVIEALIWVAVLLIGLVVATALFISFLDDSYIVRIFSLIRPAPLKFRFSERTFYDVLLLFRRF